MSIILILLSIFSGTMAQACPNLAGNYSCDDGDGVFVNTTFSQSIQGQTTTFSLIKEGKTPIVYIADGVSRSTTMEFGPIKIEPAEYTAVCVGSESLSVRLSGKASLDFNDRDIEVTINILTNAESRVLSRRIAVRYPRDLNSSMDLNLNCSRR